MNNEIQQLEDAMNRIAQRKNAKIKLIVAHDMTAADIEGKPMWGGSIEITFPGEESGQQQSLTLYTKPFDSEEKIYKMLIDMVDHFQ